MKKQKPKPRNNPVARTDDSPDNYKPRSPAELIGPARKVAELALSEARKIASKPRSFKALFHGDAGAGKSRIAKMLARALAANAVDIETVPGPQLTADVVRRWTFDARFGSLFGGWKVKLIHETDKIAPAAQDVMLDYLDELPSQTAVIGTSNRNVATLTERFSTRFRLVPVESPTGDALAAWLASRWGIPRLRANFIALSACGNVRAALLDAADFLTFGEVRERPKVTTADWRALRSADLRNKRRDGRNRRVNAA